MSDKNFMSYGDAETVFTDYANKIKKAEGDEMTLAEYNALSQQEKMSGKPFYVTDAPGGGSGVPDGGTTGQALIKNSNTDGDVKWGDAGSTVTIDRTGTASASAVSYQRIGIDGTYTEIDGTKYMEQTQTVTTSADKTYTFTNNAILTNSIIQVYTTDGIGYKSISSSAGSVSIVIPAQSAQKSVTVRIYIR